MKEHGEFAPLFIIFFIFQRLLLLFIRDFICLYNKSYVYTAENCLINHESAPINVDLESREKMQTNFYGLTFRKILQAFLILAKGLLNRPIGAF